MKNVVSSAAYRTLKQVCRDVQTSNRRSTAENISFFLSLRLSKENSEGGSESDRRNRDSKKMKVEFAKISRIVMQRFCTNDYLQAFVNHTGYRIIMKPMRDNATSDDANLFTRLHVIRWKIWFHIRDANISRNRRKVDRRHVDLPFV